MSSAVISAAVDRDLAGHVAVALRLYRELLARQGRARPPGLKDLEEMHAQVARGNHERSGEVTDRAQPQHGLHEREWLSPSEVAQVTGLSLSTVRRRIRAGVLPVQHSGRAQRVSRADLGCLFSGVDTASPTGGGSGSAAGRKLPQSTARGVSP